VIVNAIKRRLINFVDWHILQQVEGLANEQIFQQLFAQQCANYGIRNDFYPLGGAAGYSLMYLLVRLLTENRFHSIVEFGSGQSTILVDRLRADTFAHVAYEDDAAWHAVTSPKLTRCEYRLCPLEERTIDGVTCQAYSGVAPVAFDLMLVDGPRGVSQYSRFGCVESIRAKATADFVIVFDDSDRPGEKQTIAHVERLLAERGIAYKRRDFGGRNKHAVLAAGRFEHVLYYW
jgi:hypothetical protein